MKIDLEKCKLICEFVANNDNKEIFVKEQIYRNSKGWMYVLYIGGERSCYGRKRGPMMYKACHGISRLSKEKFKLWRESHEEFIDEKGWFIDFENQERLEKLWDEGKKIFTSARLFHSIDDVPF